MKPTLLNAAAAWIGLAAPGLACPFCGTESSNQVRANIFNENFLSNVLLTFAPFPVLILIVTAIHLGFSPKRKG